MKRSFGRVLEKMNEAQFFLHFLGRSWDDERSSYYFSAFASASRSVTFALQAACSDVPGFSAWYAKQQSALRENAIGRFLVQARNETQKIGVAPLAKHGQALQRSINGRHYCRRVYRFIPLESGVTVPKGDVASLCRQHLISLAALVQASYEKFRPAIDPDHRNGAALRKAVRIRPIKAPRCPLDRLVASLANARRRREMTGRKRGAKAG